MTRLFDGNDKAFRIDTSAPPIRRGVLSFSYPYGRPGSVYFKDGALEVIGLQH